MDDDASFERQVLRWLDDVYRFAMTLARHRPDAEDLVQETYLRAYRVCSAPGARSEPSSSRCTSLWCRDA